MHMNVRNTLTAGCLLLSVSACAPHRAQVDRAAADRVAADRVAAPATVATLSIVGTNDLHGGILPRDGRGGLALLGGYLKNLREARARDGGAVLLIDAGDMFQGTLESNVTKGRRWSPRTTRSATPLPQSATMSSTSARSGRRQPRARPPTIQEGR